MLLSLPLQWVLWTSLLPGSSALHIAHASRQPHGERWAELEAAGGAVEAFSAESGRDNPAEGAVSGVPQALPAAANPVLDSPFDRGSTIDPDGDLFSSIRGPSVQSWLAVNKVRVRDAASASRLHVLLASQLQLLEADRVSGGVCLMVGF